MKKLLTVLAAALLISGIACSCGTEKANDNDRHTSSFSKKSDNTSKTKNDEVTDIRNDKTDSEDETEKKEDKEKDNIFNRKKELPYSERFGEALCYDDMLYYIEYQNDGYYLNLYDPATGEESILVTVDGYPYNRNILFDDENIIFADNNGICSYNILNQEKNILFSESNIRLAGFTSDNKLIIESGYLSDSRIFLYDPEKNKAGDIITESGKYIANKGDNIYYAVIDKPDGIEWGTEYSEEIKICEFSLKKMSVRELGSSVFEIRPGEGDASSDIGTVIGNSLVVGFTKYSGGNGGFNEQWIYAYDLKDGNAELISDRGGSNSDELFDYDENKIYFHASESGDSFLRSYDPVSKKTEVLSDDLNIIEISSTSMGMAVLGDELFFFDKDSNYSSVNVKNKKITEYIRSDTYIPDSESGYCNIVRVGKTKDYLVLRVSAYIYNPDANQSHANNYGYECRLTETVVISR